jgi:hypothetical protein
MERLIRGDDKETANMRKARGYSTYPCSKLHASCVWPTFGSNFQPQILPSIHEAGYVVREIPVPYGHGSLGRG